MKRVYEITTSWGSVLRGMRKFARMNNLSINYYNSKVYQAVALVDNQHNVKAIAYKDIQGKITLYVY
jgi:hypothetical protein